MDSVLDAPAGAALPNLTDVSLGDRVAVALRLIPEAEREAALGKSVRQLDRYTRGTELPIMVAARLAAKAELPLDWIVTGRAQVRRPPLLRITPDAAGVAQTDEVPVKRLAFRASAGRGQLAIDEEAGFSHVPRRILESYGVKPMNARLTELSGLSMYPTIDDGDVGLVDVAATEIVEGKIYIFTIDDEVYVKRLRRVGGKVMMLSDNRELFPNEEPVPAGANFRVIAMVKGSWRRL